MLLGQCRPSRKRLAQCPFLITFYSALLPRQIRKMFKNINGPYLRQKATLKCVEE
jgi:hypothetical protein